MGGGLRPEPGPHGHLGVGEEKGSSDGALGAPTLEEDPVQSPGKERAAGKTNSLGEEAAQEPRAEVWPTKHIKCE